MITGGIFIHFMFLCLKYFLSLLTVVFAVNDITQCAGLIYSLLCYNYVLCCIYVFMFYVIFVLLYILCYIYGFMLCYAYVILYFCILNIFLVFLLMFSL